MSDFLVSGENTPSEINLYTGLNNKAVIPRNPKIPPEEGLQVQITGTHDSSDNPKQVLSRFLLALGSAKAEAESGATQDLWSNTQIGPDNEVNAFGRVPNVESSWRKPVTANSQKEPSANRIGDYYDINKLQRLFSSYLPKWEALGKQMELFEAGVNGQDQVLTPESIYSTPIWTNGRIQVKIMQQKDPMTGPWLHLSGYHLVVSPVEKYQRQWQTITETDDAKNNQEMIQEYIQLSLEAAATSLGIRELFAQEHGEIHNSGNWAPGLKTTDELLDPDHPEKGTGKVNLAAAKENIKHEKRNHFTRIIVDSEGKPTTIEESDFKTSAHFHVYLPFGDVSVKLPSMWPWEAQQKIKDAEKDNLPTKRFEDTIAEWNAIKPLTPAQISTANEHLGDGKLTRWLEENCEGGLT